MANVSLFDIVREKLGSIMFSGILLSAAAMAFVFLSGADFEVRTDYLVSQEEAGTRDYYTLARSAEFMGKVLGQVIYSERFINEAIATGKIDTNMFPSGKRELLQEWSEMVKVQKKLDLGILTITVQSDNEKDAMRISQAISQVLIEKNNLFLGTGDKPVPVSVLSGPILERNPSMKEVVSAVFGGFFFGLLLSTLFFFLKLEVFRKEYDRM